MREALTVTVILVFQLCVAILVFSFMDWIERKTTIKVACFCAVLIVAAIVILQVMK